MATLELVPGSRRALPVERSGQLGVGRSAHLWAFEVFDGLLWQLIGMADSKHDCRRFLNFS